jgi:hypothetical protein
MESNSGNQLEVHLEVAGSRSVIFLLDSHPVIHFYICLSIISINIKHSIIIYKDEGSFQLAISGVFGSSGSISENPVANFTTFSQLITEYLTFYPRYPIEDNGRFANSVISEYVPNSTNISVNYFNMLIQVLSELIFICPVIDLAAVYSKTRNDVFVYSFEQMLSTPFYPLAFGVSHIDDVAFAFGQPLSQPPGLSKYTDEEKRISKQMINYWTNFIKTGNPNNGDFNTTVKYNYWPKFYDQDSYYNTANRSIWSIIYDVFFSIFKFIFPNVAKSQEKLHIILKYNATRISSRFTYLDRKRRCEFWRRSGNL